MIIDEAYEFSAPQFFNFVDEESQEDVLISEHWFEKSLGYGQSPFLPYVEVERSVNIPGKSNCNDAQQLQKVHKGTYEMPGSVSTQEHASLINEKASSISAIDQQRSNKNKAVEIQIKCDSTKEEQLQKVQEGICEKSESVCTDKQHKSYCNYSEIAIDQSSYNTKGSVKIEAKCDLSEADQSQKIHKGTCERSKSVCTQEYKSVLTQKISSTVTIDRSSCKTKKTPIVKKVKSENQPIKRQKLEGGRSREIHDMKQSLYPHKTKNIQAHRDNSAVMERKPRLTLTIPKAPKFQTSERVRSSTVKSAAEMEEEMMAKIPKFKARMLNKKILEASTLPPLPRSTPHLPVFKEFHLNTLARANSNSEVSTIETIDSSQQRKLAEPKPPILHTSFRTRPTTAKSSQELELEELEKAPKFKALPLNKKIFKSKGAYGVSSTKKINSTKPREFQFAIDERFPPVTTVSDLFNKISLDWDPQSSCRIPRNTVPISFHLHTEERGAEKERKLAMELMQKKVEEEQARIPIAAPYPFSTDFPLIPPKPEPKHCTIPEPFQLESLLRHKEEMERERQERERMEREEAQMRIFKAQPILKEDPIPVREKERKPLTEIEEFEFHVNQRAMERAEFDKKVQEKDLCLKRYREETEARRMMEEEKALKEMRKAMIPHARDVPDFKNPFVPHRSTKETTKARSPDLLVHKRAKKSDLSFMNMR